MLLVWSGLQDQSAQHLRLRQLQSVWEVRLVWQMRVQVLELFQAWVLLAEQTAVAKAPWAQTFLELKALAELATFEGQSVALVGLLPY